MKRLPIILLLAIAALVLVVMARGGGDTARAATGAVFAGHDLFETVSGTDAAPVTFQTLTIPAGFFSPECTNGFSGTVRLEGKPFDSFPPVLSGLSPTDTIVERQADAILPTVGSSDTIPIEIVALELRSASPITVTGCTGGSLWDIDVDLSGVVAQPLGSMTITHSHANGGTFTSNLPVIPRLTFTRVSDAAVKVADPTPQIDFVTPVPSPWCHTGGTLPSGDVLVESPPLTSDFFPGVNCVTAGNEFRVLTNEEALLAKHGVLPAANPPSVGGIALVDSPDAPASAAGGSGSSAGLYAAIAGSAAAVLAIAAGGWYARRRFADRRIRS